MWFFPLAAAIVSAVFAALIGQQWISRHRSHHLAWSLALLMFGLASFAAALGMLGDWTPTLFRTYYLFGAMINVPFLASGTVFLLAPRPVGRAFILVVVIAAIFAAGAIFSATLNTGALAVAGIPSGREILTPTSLPRELSRYYSYGGFAIVVGGALWSAWRLGRQHSEDLRNLTVGNVQIAAGTFIVAVASAFARFGQGSIFAVGLLIGVCVMFAGFLKARSSTGAQGPPSDTEAPKE